MPSFTPIKARLSRQLSIRTLGPNEARILFDAATGAAGLLVTLAYGAWVLGGFNTRDSIGLLPLPLLLLIFNALLGIYSRLRTAAGQTKALVLLAAVAAAAVLALLLGAPSAPVILWAVIVYPPVALARLLLGLPYGTNTRLAAIAVSHRGPVLVIGGAGYIGSHTVDLLLQAGQPVRVLDRLMYGRKSLAEFLDDKHFELIEGDATDIAKLAQAMKGVSAVVHLAGLVGDPACAVDADFTRHTNIVATRMAKDVANSLGVRRFVFASSCSVYGVSEREAAESDELRPVSLYARTKIDSERELLSTVRDDFFVTVLRFATVFGHSRRPRFDLVANLFTAQALTDGLITVIGPDQWRPFVHVRDLARAVVLVLRADPRVVQSQIFNVGDQRLNMTILQLAEVVREVCSRYRDVSIAVMEDAADRRNYAVSFTKIQTLLGFRAATLMAPGIEELAAALAHGDYGNYRERIYSNAAMTAQALNQFQDPSESARLYAPLS
jgi:nucleoside-diphosphate-sugar epimerase